LSRQGRDFSSPRDRAADVRGSSVARGIVAAAFVPDEGGAGLAAGSRGFSLGPGPVTTSKSIMMTSWRCGGRLGAGFGRLARPKNTKAA